MANVYLPETWELEKCQGELRTLDFDGYILKLGTQVLVPSPSPIQEPPPVDSPPSHPGRRKVPRPEDMPWQADYRIQWDPLPLGCTELSGESDLLECDDNLSLEKADWPRLTITNQRGTSVLSATLELSDPGAPRLVDPRYPVFLRGLAGIRPRLGTKGECTRQGEVWRCELPELTLSRLTLTSVDSGGGPFSYDIPDQTLTPAEIYDWTDWLPELPLQWVGEGDLDLAYPTTH